LKYHGHIIDPKTLPVRTTPSQLANGEIDKMAVQLRHYAFQLPPADSTVTWDWMTSVARLFKQWQEPNLAYIR
jgi:hypothetical protein